MVSLCAALMNKTSQFLFTLNYSTAGFYIYTYTSIRTYVHIHMQAQQEIEGLYNLFMDTDATQVEINPFAEGGVPGGEQDQSKLV